MECEDFMEPVQDREYDDDLQASGSRATKAALGGLRCLDRDQSVPAAGSLNFAPD